MLLHWEAKVARRCYIYNNIQSAGVLQQSVLFVHFRHRVVGNKGMEIRLRCVYGEITGRRWRRTDARIDMIKRTEIRFPLSSA